ncbi:hypothetical protein LTR84_001844 [Exophiala bonariae]|uniref:U3 small nucleolar ribonucleoprotein protein MPP10 n=1 Tax=Exophiala bonariae TaxID=1690606 RepID=A0AAV9NBW3_9EURO|nr:hypothetical protein LTR84_001844 [Exophiala bonariae]
MADTNTLLSSLSNECHQFLQPSSNLHHQTLSTVKTLLDPLAVKVADAQKARRDENRRKRKRGDNGVEPVPLQLRQIYTDGLAIRQIWEQARRILDAAADEVERAVAFHAANSGAAVVTEAKSISVDEAEPSEIHDDITDAESVDEEGMEESEGEDDFEEGEQLEDDEDEEEHINDSADEDRPRKDKKIRGGTYVRDPHNLNDGFFSIDDFNKQTQFLEQQDARGDDDNPSDEDEVDWDADPMAMAVPKSSPGGDEQSDENDGPTFGDTDLNASDSDKDQLDLDDDLDQGFPGIDNTNEIRYADFFAPPPKKPSRSKRMRALPKTQPKSQVTDQNNSDAENDMSRAMADVRRDLLESDEEGSDEDLSGSDVERPSYKNLSTHEKQQLKIAAEIRRLEAANVAKKDWTISGEARGADRPMNSLLEEDFEFERVGKPVPIDTVEITEEIEQLIKRRILAREFDEVVRRHPDAIGDASTARRGRVELDDTKPTAGLGEIYEQEHLKSTDPGYVDKRSAATKKAQEEISRLWKEVSSQLDLLSNLNFKPRRAQAEIKTVEDKPTISMEDARPVGAGGEDSMLAPQEIYRPGEDKKSKKGPDGESIIVRKGGSSAAKEEMTREEKIRRRRREKERIKKANQMQGNDASKSTGDASKNIKSGKKSKAGEKEDILTQLRKGNVKVIGKKGELQEMEGRKRKKGANGRDTDVAINGGAGNLML